MRILTIVGARPQFVKLEPLRRALHESGHEQYVIHTGQHWDHEMSAVFFDQMRIPAPDKNLGVSGANHGEQTGRMMAALEPILEEKRPDWVIVMGDTNSTLAGALTAAKLHLPVAHVEAGLRSFNRAMPEEINRVVSDHVADLLLAPCPAAMQNLEREGIDRSRVHLTGDLMRDAFLRFSRAARSRRAVLQSCGVSEQKFALATVHRAENTDDPSRLAIIYEGLRQVARDLPVIWPVHPRTRGALAKLNLQNAAEIVPLRLIEPVGYLDMLALECNAAVIATDSGGVQKEAYFAEVPCATIRSETEWTELIEAGWNRLCPPTTASAVAQAIASAVGVIGSRENLYGTSSAAAGILKAIESQPSGRPGQGSESVP